MRRPILLALLLAAACTATPVRDVDDADPDIYAALPDPQGESAWQQAQDAMKVNNHTVALRHLRVVVERCPDFVRGHLAYQDAGLALGGEAEAAVRGYYKELAPGKTPVHAYAKARLFDTSYAKGEALKAVLAQDSSFGWAHLSQGRIRRGQGRLLAAVDSFRAAVVHDPSLVEAYLERGDALAALGRLEEAARDYEAYFAAAPDDWPALREYAALLIYRLVRIDRALELLGRLEMQFPGDAELQMHFGAAMWRARRPREGLVYYLAVLEQDPGNARALLDVGLIYYDAMPKDRSEAERRRWWPRARAAFRLFLARGNPSDGQESFERALAVPYRLGEIERLLGADDGAPVSIADLQLPVE